MSKEEAAIGIIGGSGLYELEGLEEMQEVRVETPFGAPSDAIVCGRLFGREVYFLPRHGKGHRLLPTELNHRANIWALRSLGVRFVICVTAVGSLREEYAPEHIVLPDQLMDRTSRRAEHTFFGGGIVAHVAFAEPYSEGLRSILYSSAKRCGAVVHDGGVYVNMDGPAFSTRVESLMHRQLGCDVVGMTNAAEAKLGREAEMALATLAMVTDYDCWRENEEPVNTADVIKHLVANAEMAKKIIAEAVKSVPLEANWVEHRALENALITPRELWPKEKASELEPLLKNY